MNRLGRVSVGALLSVGLLGIGACGGASGQSGSGPIKVVSINDATGALNAYGLPMGAAARLAVDDINKHGGLLGRQVELDELDGQSDVARYTVLARQTAQDPDVAVVQGAISSASREAIRPVFDDAEKLYFYPTFYEGGVCDKNTFMTGQTPSQTVEPLLKWAADTGKKKWYVLAADYNYGQISAGWVQRLADKYGATIVGGPTFFDLSNSDFTSQIPKIQASGADAIVSLLVGPAHLNFYKQWAASGLNATTTVLGAGFGLGADQVALGADAKGIVTAFPYFPSLDTPDSRDLRKLWVDSGRTDPLTPGAIDAWNGWHIWAAAVQKAGSTDRDKVIAALESGLSFNGPSGKVEMDPRTHHLIVPMRLWEADGQGGFSMLQELTPAAAPTFEQSKCDLTKDPNTNQQFTP
jgi:branched-chain amino acid transport system substrate-binding protein